MKKENDNNGWISMQTENEDLQDWFTAWVFTSYIEYGTWNPIQQYWMDVEGVIIKKVSHYQQIIKPDEPIY